MGDQDDDCPIGPKRLDGANEGALAIRIEIGVGLVEDDQSRPTIDGPGEADALPLAAGQEVSPPSPRRVS